MIMSQHQSLVLVVNAVFGDGEKKAKPKDVTEGVGSFEQAIHNMNAMLFWG